MKQFITTLLTALLILNVSFAATIYVDHDATGAANGTTWIDAYTDLQVAIDAASSGDEIWVTLGIYYPTKDKTGNSSPTDNRTKTFYVNKDISIHGGFVGAIAGVYVGETSLNDRLFTTVNPFTATASEATILSGDLLGNEVKDINTAGSAYLLNEDNNGDGNPDGNDNSYTVLHINSPSSFTLTGCVVTAGFAGSFPAASPENYTGGNIYNEGNSTTIELSYSSGGAAYFGGGFYSDKDYSATSCSFIGNFCLINGGAILNSACTSTIKKNSFVLNGGVNGGAIYNDATSGAVLTKVINSLFYANQVNTDGGSIYNNGNSCDLTVINCSFTSHGISADATNGGAIYSNGTVTNTIYNSIFYNLTATSGNIFYNDGAATDIYYSSLPGVDADAESTPGTVTGHEGMIYNKNPLFGNTDTAALDLTLQTSSPCINTGDNDILASEGITEDLLGGNRFYCEKVDMGALERSNGKGRVVRNKVISLNGSTQYVDIGNSISNFNDNTDFSIETWVNVTAYDGSATSETILTNRSGNTGINFCIAGTADGAEAGKLALRIGTSTTIYSTSTINIGEWTHVAVTFDDVSAGNNIVNLYINGKLEGTSTTAPDITASSANTLIGRETGASDAINAKLEELRIWSDVRTTEEIQGAMRLLLPCGAENALKTYEFNSDVNNALEYSNVVSVETAVGTPTYSNSTIPLSLGCSGVFNITGAGTESVTGFDGTSLDLEFFASNHPNGNVAITFLNQDYSGDNPINPTISGMSGQYVVDNFGTVETGLDYNIQFNTTDAADLSSASSEYSLEKRGGNENGAWEVIATEASSVSNTNGNKYVAFSLTGESFSQLMPTFGNVLPVEMTFFTANPKENQVYLDWQTASELNNLGFDVEKSTDGRSWEMIGFVEGNETSIEVNTYQFIDESPAKGINYYRLKQTDIDGAFEYSQIRSVVYNDNVDEIGVYPNPIKDILTVDLGNNIATIQVFDLTGRLVTSTLNNKDSIQTIDFSNFENGVYILQISGEQWQKVEKVVVQH